MIYIDGYHLTIEEVVAVARYHEQVMISEEGKQNIGYLSL